jgi:glycerol-3-phosphate acyltransferase PlsX
MMRIALDAMGGDRAPAALVDGAVRALRAFDDVEIVLVGVPERVSAELEKHDVTVEETARLPIEKADHVAAMGEDPVRAVRKNEGNSVRICAELLREGRVGGVVTMGSTGAAVAAAQLYVGRLEGARRPGIAVPFPRPGGATVVVDCGANPDARPKDLVQYAVMAQLYARSALGVEEPRIGILSIGEEEHKGNRLVHETWELFRQTDIGPFVGNVEPSDFFTDKADVVVCDGFTGNVALKGAEGMAGYILGGLQSAVKRGECPAQILKEAAARTDYAEYGGAPLLGVRGAYLIGHGRSDGRAVLSGIRAVRAYERHQVGARTVEELARLFGSEKAAEGAR